MIVQVFMLTIVQAAAPAVAPPPAASEKKICRNERSTESRIGGKKVCRTQAEWDLIAHQTVDDLRYRGQSSR